MRWCRGPVPSDRAGAEGGCNSGVEYLLPKQKVVGSNPITRSIRTVPRPRPPCQGGPSLRAIAPAAAAAALVIASILASACSDAPADGGGGPAPTPTAARAGGSVVVPAPVRDVSVERMDAPFRYVAVVVSVQADSCEEIEGLEVFESGTAVRIDVTNRRAVSSSRACAGPERQTRSEVPLGPDLVPGETYTVRAGGRETAFTVAADEPGPGAGPAPADDAAPPGPVRAERITVFLDEAASGLEASFRTLVLTEAGEPAAGVTVQASLQGPVGSDALRSAVAAVVVDRDGIADFVFPIEHGGTYLFLVELAFGLGATLDRGASRQLHAELEVPPLQRD